MPAKIPTKTKVIRFKTKNPFMRTSEIAKKMGYTRSYVHKVLKQHEMNTRIPSLLRSRPVYCVQCKKLAKIIKRGYRYDAKKATKTFCSTTCRTNYYEIELTCIYCEEPFIKLRSQIKQAYKSGSKGIFCRKICEVRYKKFKGKG
tara:strand:- start:474 stop:908 length:435 start_codon:yes stop_codon:yes gene_type:complete